jgi:hypothetical protein
MKGELPTVAAGLDAFRQLWNDYGLVKDPVAIDLLSAEAHQPIIYTHAQPCGLTRGPWKSRVQRVDVSTHDMTQGLRARLRMCATG